MSSLTLVPVVVVGVNRSPATPEEEGGWGEVEPDSDDHGDLFSIAHIRRQPELLILHYDFNM